MHAPLLLSLAIGLLTRTVRSTPIKNFESKCTSFASDLSISKYSDFKVTIAEYLPAESVLNVTAEGRDASCAFGGYNDPPPIPVNLCRLGLTVATSSSSEVILETWLPEKSTGRFLSAGNGGSAGCIQYPDLAYGVSYGFATVATNNGHNGTSSAAFFQAPEILEDFVGRALYTGVIVGKDVTKQFYAEDSCKSYYIGCSAGGRQGWKAAQTYPELFDGIIAGAPAFAWTGSLAFLGRALTDLGSNTSESWIDAEHFAALQSEVLKQCDGLDGAIDGILEDTRQCHFDITPLLCAKNFTGACFNQVQANIVDKLFSPFIVDGQVIHSGLSHGYESAFISVLTGPLAEPGLQEWFANVVYENRNWTLANFSINDVRTAIALNPYNIETIDSDISAFRDLGGKILHWHGQADELLAVGNSDRYYDAVKTTLNATSTELDDFYRYFRVSGVNHCFGGPGANALGQLGFAARASDSPEDSMLSRIVEWVENGAAPEFVRGTKFVNDTPALGVEFSRKHCKHPAVNVYRGTGNGTDEEGWTCVE
ncbi:tannase and feruloyl esterase [Zopfia rhizophila CBS 207.26]|uniref:Carboxylic ester hydrolase n=1 Tax=Zopfia rhizophila CBS 207.26 TaxID=1314779 RepID=A0A6A6DBR5_9PEZI|nr:tannase and feruloyl esterase [Zopfia rhizophila CBS 207.26]